MRRASVSLISSPERSLKDWAVQLSFLMHNPNIIFVLILPPAGRSEEPWKAKKQMFPFPHVGERNVKWQGYREGARTKNKCCRSDERNGIHEFPPKLIPFSPSQTNDKM